MYSTLMNLKLNQKITKKFNNIFKRKLLNPKLKINKPLPVPPSRNEEQTQQLTLKIPQLTLPPPIIELTSTSPLLLPKFPYRTLSSIQKAKKITQQTKVKQISQLITELEEEEYRRPSISSVYTNDDSNESYEACDSSNSCESFVECEMCYSKNNIDKYWNINKNVISWIESTEDEIMFANFFTSLSPINNFDELEFFSNYIK